jgi:hypothetical protein
MAAGRKSAVYREVNLETARLLAKYGSDEPAFFLCECDDETCGRRVELSREEFEAVLAADRRVVSSYCSSIEK